MSEKLEKERQYRREEYLLASKNPWLLWRLQALKAGYTPPLVMGEIPPELAGVPLGRRKEEYNVEPLVKHAERVRTNERTFVKRAFTGLLIVMLIFFGLGITYTVKAGNQFRIEFLEAILPSAQEQTASPYE